jgi:hypothetical protein
VQVPAGVLSQMASLFYMSPANFQQHLSSLPPSQQQSMLSWYMNSAGASSSGASHAGNTHSGHGGIGHDLGDSSSMNAFPFFGSSSSSSSSAANSIGSSSSGIGGGLGGLGHIGVGGIGSGSQHGMNMNMNIGGAFDTSSFLSSSFGSSLFGPSSLPMAPVPLSSSSSSSASSNASFLGSGANGGNGAFPNFMAPFGLMSGLGAADSTATFPYESR